MFFVSCGEETTVSPAVQPINCNGLITDTLGTGDEAKIFFPNAFTPNSDGYNDNFQYIVVNIHTVDLTIYDTNNNILFHSIQDSLGMPPDFHPKAWSPTGSNSFQKYYYRLQAITTSNHKIGKCGEIYQLTCKPSNLPTLFFPDQIDPSSGFSRMTSDPIPNCP